MLKRTQLYVEGLSAYRAVDKLNRGGVETLSARKTQKNAIIIEVESKDAEKAFAILRGSCYNVKKIRFRGVTRIAKACRARIGLVAGAAVFIACAVSAETRVLKIEVDGSGAYYGAEIREILSRNGVNMWSAAPDDTSAVEAEILSLPRVSFCSLGKSGGVLKVTVEVSDENASLKSRPLLAPVAGVVEELTVVRGTALVSVGDEVRAGDVVVDNSARYGETERTVIVIARVKVRFPFTAEYALESEEAARAQASLDCGQLTDLRTHKTENGWLVEGTGYGESSINLF